VGIDMDRASLEETTILEHVETQIDVLVKDITEVISTLLEQHAQESGEQSRKVIRVS
jgi:hypothetical protein